MRETPEDVQRLQKLLDESYGKAGEHLRSIVTPERRLSAEDLCRELQGMTLLVLGTVTARCEPVVGPVDGVLYKGRFLFGSSPTSVRFQHIRTRPQVSASHARGEELVVTVHGTAQRIDTASGEWDELAEVYREVYGAEWDDWGHWDEAAYAYIEPRVMFAGKFK
jgi:hypothetical protein